MGPLPGERALPNSAAICVGTTPRLRARRRDPCCSTRWPREVEPTSLLFFATGPLPGVRPLPNSAICVGATPRLRAQRRDPHCTTRGATASREQCAAFLAPMAMDTQDVGKSCKDMMLHMTSTLANAMQLDFVHLFLPLSRAIGSNAFVRTLIDFFAGLLITKADGSPDAFVARYGGRLLGGMRATALTPQQMAASLLRKITVFEGTHDGARGFAVFYLLKNELHYGPGKATFIMGLLFLPWILKPVFATCTDRMTLFGRRRISYLATGLVMLTGGYLGLPFASEVVPTFCLLTLASTGHCLASAALQGMLVDMSRLGPEANIDKLVGNFFLWKSVGSISGVFIVSHIVAVLAPRTVMAFVGMIPLTMLSIVSTADQAQPEMELPPIDAHEDANRWGLLFEACRSPSLWAPLAVTILSHAGPGYDDPLTYYYINKLDFSPTIVGRITIAKEFAKVFGVMLYKTLLGRLQGKTLLALTIASAFPPLLTPLLLTTGSYVTLGLNPQFLAISGEAIRELSWTLQTIPVFTTWVKRCPTGLESTSMSLLAGTIMFARGVSKVSSSVLINWLGISATNFDNLSTLVWIVAFASVVPLPIVNAMPDNDEDQCRELPPTRRSEILLIARAG